MSKDTPYQLGFKNTLKEFPACCMSLLNRKEVTCKAAFPTNHCVLATSVKDIVLNPASVKPCLLFKEALIKRLGMSQEQRSMRLLDREEMDGWMANTAPRRRLHLAMLPT